MEKLTVHNITNYEWVVYNILSIYYHRYGQLSQPQGKPTDLCK